MAVIAPVTAIRRLFVSRRKSNAGPQIESVIETSISYYDCLSDLPADGTGRWSHARNAEKAAAEWRDAVAALKKAQAS